MLKYRQFLQSPQCPTIVKQADDRIKEWQKGGQIYNQPTAENDFPEIDDNDTNIDQRTKEACEGFGTLCSHSSDMMDEDRFDLGLNYDWTNKRYKLPGQMTMETAKSWICKESGYSQYEETSEWNLPIGNDNNIGNEKVGQDNNEKEIMHYDPSYLSEDQLQVFHVVMQKIKEWVEYQKYVAKIDRKKI